MIEGTAVRETEQNQQTETSLDGYGIARRPAFHGGTRQAGTSKQERTRKGGPTCVHPYYTPGQSCFGVVRSEPPNSLPRPFGFTDATQIGTSNA